MEFIGQINGDEAIAAPRLKDAQLTDDEIKDCYIEVIKLMRRLFIECKLVHADLSEYNLLYTNNELWLIDVS